jgi:hypothetical protein
MVGRPRIDRYQKIVAFLRENYAFPASPQRINHILNLGLSSSVMGQYLVTLKDRNIIAEIDGRFYVVADLPKKEINKCQ